MEGRPCCCQPLRLATTAQMEAEWDTPTTPVSTRRERLQYLDLPRLTYHVRDMHPHMPVKSLRTSADRRESNSIDQPLMEEHDA